LPKLARRTSGDALARKTFAWHKTNLAAATQWRATAMPAESTATIDPALETSVFWERNKGVIITALVAALVCGLGYVGYLLYNKRRDEQAATALASAKVAQDYQQVLDRFAGTPASANAYLLLADAQRSEGKFAEANATLRAFIAKYPKHELITTAWMAIGANLESMGNADEALATYQRLAASNPKSFNAPLALLSQVHILKQKGQMQEARQICETILTQYRDSALSGEASRQLRYLKPKAEPAAPSSTEPGASVVPQVAPVTSSPPAQAPAPAP
jgi:tetratricopeptide (TPR) repeat protein